MLLVKEGDHAAFEKLVDRFQDRLVGFFFHMLRDRVVAEDLAQETFLRVYRSRERYEPKARFSTWLFRIAHNLASNQKRGSARRREIPLTSDSQANEFGTGGRIPADKSALMPTRQLDSSEVREVVKDALDSLGDRQRTAVLLHKFEGMSYQDIGDVLGLGTVAVKSLLSRARGKLREALERYVN